MGDTSDAYPYGTLSQTVSDTAGDDLVLSYFLKSDGGTPNFFSADWNGSQIAGSAVSNAPSSGYIQYSFHVTATGSDTLTFHDQNQPGYLYLDDVSLVSGGGVGGVPEPATWAMMLLGFFGAGATLRARRNRAAGAFA
ncbi:MAG TPA: PEPxxWA-CTERM sorting domain-containing protein [Bryobacteraceae bacterium]|nr:PEPxxWA-CTERM sorting domain-containing protein [Bryobacteraceae bacterium]